MILRRRGKKAPGAGDSHGGDRPGGPAEEFSDVRLIPGPASTEVSDAETAGLDPSPNSRSVAGSSAVEPSSSDAEVDADGATANQPGNAVLAELSRAFGITDEGEADNDTSGPASEGSPPTGTPAPGATSAEGDTPDSGSPDNDTADSGDDQPDNGPSTGSGAFPSGTSAGSVTDTAGGLDDSDDGRRSTVISLDADSEVGSAIYLDELVDGPTEAVSTSASAASPRVTPASAGTVFIDDDDTGDAVHADGRATDGTMEPRLRSRRIGVKRAAGRRRLRVVGIVSVVLVSVIGVLAMLGSSLFAVRDVDVSGVVYTDREALGEVVADLQGTPVLLVDTVDLERRLERIPWVEAARVRTDFPNSASIEIRERQPLLTMEGSDGRFRVLDRDARVIAVLEGRPVAPVWITGPGVLDLEAGDFAPVGYVAAAELVTRLTPEIRSRLESMLVNPGGTDLRMVLSNDPWPPFEVRFGSVIGGEQQVEKLVLLQRQLDDSVDGPVQRIDVSTNPVTQVGGEPVSATEPSS